MKKDTFNKGFTLLEVLVAVLILSIGIVTLLSTHNQSLDMLYRSSRYTQATLLAKSMMEQAESQDFAQLEEDSGTFEDEGYPDIKWRREIKDTDAEFLKKVTVNVTWGSVKREKSIMLSSYVSKR